MRKSVIVAVMIISAAPAAAKKAPRPVWQVTRTSDPITGASSCVVAAYDRLAGMSYTRVGALYPFVEQNSTHGLLISVASGGRFRVPSGDILWRIDEQPFRTLKAADNPQGVATAATPQYDAATQQLVDQQMKLINNATSTSTVAGGTVAQEMLAEMLAGRGLIYRAAAVTAAYGLPTGRDREVGQYTRDGLRSYPIDDSFRAGLAACDIAIPDKAS